MSILGLFGLLNSIILGPPSMGHPPPAVTPKFKEDDRYMVMGVDFVVIWATEFDNVIKF